MSGWANSMKRGDEGYWKGWNKNLEILEHAESNWSIDERRTPQAACNRFNILKRNICLFEFFFSFFFFLFFHVLCICATLWVMIDLPAFYIHVWPEAPYFITIFAFSRHTLFVTFGIPFLSSPNLSFTVQSVSWSSLSWSLLFCHFSSLSLASSLLSTSVSFRNFNTGPTARSFAKNLPSHFLSGQDCQLIPSRHNSLLSFLCSVLHLRLSV